jgi:hypothetical protein
MPDTFLVGLDLGQTTDPSAACVVRRSIVPKGPDNPDKSVRRYAVTNLRRWPLHTPYTTVVADVARALQTPALQGARLVVDQTGVGRPVLEMIRRAETGNPLVPVTITSGAKVTFTGGGYHVAKVVLVSTLQVLLQERRILVTGTSPESRTLVRELEDFRLKVTKAANETFDAREGQHDDLLMSVMLACWWGEFKHKQLRVIIG